VRNFRILVYTLGGTIAVLLFAILILLSIDLGMFKDRVEILVTEFLGREFRIDGELQVNIGSNIELYVEDLYLANPEWAGDAAFVTTRKIHLVADVWSLINGPVEIEQLDIDGIKIQAQRNDAGDTSWEFENIAIASEAADPGFFGSLVNDTELSRKLPLVLAAATVTNSQVSYATPAMSMPLSFHADSLQWQINDEVLTVDLTGSLNGTPVHATKTTFPVKKLMALEEVTIDVAGSIGEIKWRGVAHIDDLLAPRRPRLQFDLEGPGAKYLTDLLALEPISVGPLKISATIDADGENMIATTRGVFGEFTYALSGRFQEFQDMREFDLEVAANGPDMGTVIRLLGGNYEKVDPFEIQAEIHRLGPEVRIEQFQLDIGASHLTIDGHLPDYRSPKGARLSLRASGPDFGRFNRLLQMPGRLTGAFATELDLTTDIDGATRITLSASSPDIKISFDSLLGTAKNYAGTSGTFEISGPNIGTIAAVRGIGSFPADGFSVSAHIEKTREGFLVRAFEAVVDDDVLRISGETGEWPFWRGANLDVDISGVDLATSVFGAFGHVEGLPSGTFYLRGNVQGQGDSLMLGDLQAAIGDAEEYRFQLSGSVYPAQDFVDSQLKIRARGRSIAALAGVAGIPDIPFDIDASVRRGVSNVFFERGSFKSGAVAAEFSGHIGDEPFDDDMALTFEISVPSLTEVMARYDVAIDGFPSGDFLLAGSMQKEAGVLAIEALTASISGFRLQASGELGQAPSFPGTSIDLNLSGEDLSQLLPNLTINGSLAHSFSASTNVTVVGDTLRFEQLDASVGPAKLVGNLGFNLDPFLENGRFDLTVDAPDVRSFFPSTETISAPQEVRLKYQGIGSWSDNFWDFEKFRLELGEGHFEIIGTLDGPPTFEQTDLSVDLLFPHISMLSMIAGRELPDEALRLTGRLVGTREIMSMQDFEMKVGESDLNGRLTMQFDQIPVVSIDLRSTLFDISGYSSAAGFESDPAPVENTGKLIPDMPLPLAFLRRFNANLNINAGELRSGAAKLLDVKLSGSLSSGALTVDNYSFETVRGGTFHSSASLLPNDRGEADMLITAVGENVVLGVLAKAEREVEKLPLYDIETEMAASGATTGELAASLDGYFHMVGRDGLVPAGAMSFFTGDLISELVQGLNPFAKSDPYTRVECAVLAMNFDHGAASGDPALVVQTDKLHIFAKADIDLKTEALDINFRIVPRKGLGISLSGLFNPYIKLTGSLAEPALILDPEGVLVEGGVAVATAGLSILAKGLKDRYLSDRDPCGTALATAREAQAEKLEARSGLQ